MFCYVFGVFKLFYNVPRFNEARMFVGVTFPTANYREVFGKHCSVIGCQVTTNEPWGANIGQ